MRRLLLIAALALTCSGCTVYSTSPQYGYSSTTGTYYPSTYSYDPSGYQYGYNTYSYPSYSYGYTYRYPSYSYNYYPDERRPIHAF